MHLAEPVVYWQNIAVECLFCVLENPRKCENWSCHEDATVRLVGGKDTTKTALGPCVTREEVSRITHKKRVDELYRIDRLRYLIFRIKAESRR